MFTALLDRCVLWPSLQRDFLLSLAFEGAYRFIFSEAILEEVEIDEELKLIERGDSEETARQKARHLADQMRASFGDALVIAWEGLEGRYGLPDPDDEHVLAAAVLGGAGSIVTDNAKDFPSDKIPNGIQIISAKDFAYETVAMRPDLGLAAVLAISRRTGRNHPRQSPEDILNSLDSIYGMDSAAGHIRTLLEPGIGNEG